LEEEVEGPDLGDKPAQMVKVSNHAENEFVSAYGVCFMFLSKSISYAIL
jgi:hypothetical protein